MLQVNAAGFIGTLPTMPGVEMPSANIEWLVLYQLCVAKKLTANDISVCQNERRTSATVQPAR